MKKVIWVLLVIASIGILTSCSSTSEENSETYLRIDEMINIKSFSKEGIYSIPIDTNILINDFYVESINGNDIIGEEFEFELVETDKNSKHGKWYYLRLITNFKELNSIAINKIDLNINGIKWAVDITNIKFFDSGFNFTNNEFIFYSIPLNLPERDYDYSLTLKPKEDVNLSNIIFSNDINYNQVKVYETDNYAESFELTDKESVFLKKDIKYTVVINLNYSNIKSDENASIFSDIVIEYQKDSEVKYTKVGPKLNVFDFSFSFDNA